MVRHSRVRITLLYDDFAAVRASRCSDRVSLGVIVTVRGRAQVSTGGFDDNGGCEGLVVDFKGRPVDKSRVGGWFGAGLILGTYIC